MFPRNAIFQFLKFANVDLGKYKIEYESENVCVFTFPNDSWLTDSYGGIVILTVEKEYPAKDPRYPEYYFTMEMSWKTKKELQGAGITGAFWESLDEEEWWNNKLIACYVRNAITMETLMI